VSLTVLADENIPAIEHYLAGQASVRRVSGRQLQRHHLEGVDALFVRSVTRVDEELLHGSNVRFVGTATSGIDHIDRDYLVRRNTGFAYAPGSNANSVVEYVLAAIAATTDKLEMLLAGGSVGIVGYGVIGKAVAARLGALGIDYRVYDPWLDPQAVRHAATLSRVLESDVVTLHPELTHEQPWPSFHLLAAAELASLASDCLLINASRGPVIDNLALLALLQGGAGPLAILDVWEHEPRLNQALLDQVQLGTAHIAGYSLDGKLLATRMLCAALLSQMGKPPPPVLGPAEGPQMLAVPAGLHGAGLVRYLLQSRYEISQDDAALRDATLGIETAQAAANFDLLRKEYRARRELLGSKVSGDFQSSRDRDLVLGLGCVPSPVVPGA
jgi:erythronate-4-phosphate dehydrogenase